MCSSSRIACQPCPHGKRRRAPPRAPPDASLLSLASSGWRSSKCARVRLDRATGAHAVVSPARRLPCRQMDRWGVSPFEGQPAAPVAAAIAAAAAPMSFRWLRLAARPWRRDRLRLGTPYKPPWTWANRFPELPASVPPAGIALAGALRGNCLAQHPRGRLRPKERGAGDSPKVVLGPLK